MVWSKENYKFDVGVKGLIIYLLGIIVSCLDINGYYDCMTLIMVIILREINATCIPILFKFITSKFSVFLTKH